MSCPRCGKNPKFIFHVCSPTMEWIDRLIEPEVQEELKLNFDKYGNLPIQERTEE